MGGASGTRVLALAFIASCSSNYAEAVHGSDAQATPYRLLAIYTGEAWRNTRGGLGVGASYLDNIDLQFEVDAEDAWGVGGLTVFAYLLSNNGGTISEDLVGDLQGVSNIEAGEHARLYELWADWTFGKARTTSLRFGLYDLNSEFDASEVAALFINSAHGIGTQFAHTGLNGPSIFPVTSLAARLRWEPTRQWAIQMAALDGVPADPDHPTSNAIRLHPDDGLLLVAEVSRQGDRLRRIAAGHWSYTARFADLLASDSQGQPIRRGGNGGAYALADIHLARPAGPEGPSLDAFVRWGIADGRINRTRESFGLGIVATGLVPGRADDALGLALAVSRNGATYRRARAREGIATDEREYALELTYRTVIGSWFALQPSAHYILNPDTDPSLDDALAVALRFEIAWGTRF